MSPMVFTNKFKASSVCRCCTGFQRANVAPVFKKGSKLQAVNYRPVSLTCITCKLFEHIICRHVLGHLEQHKILTELQHGFRSYDKKGSQIDIAVLDFSKAFDTVPHDGLLSKLKHYGIDKNIWQWISNFLKNRKQCVVIDGISSSPVDVDSGVVVVVCLFVEDVLKNICWTCVQMDPPRVGFLLWIQYYFFYISTMYHQSFLQKLDSLQMTA